MPPAPPHSLARWRARLTAARLALAILALGLSSAVAQEAPTPTTHTRVERAPDGSMRRGWLDVPGWVVFAGGGLVVMGAAGALAYRIGRRRR